MLDRESLHSLLFMRAGAAGVLRLNQANLARELQTSRVVINRVLTQMCNEHRMTKLPGASGPAMRTFQIMDPKIWKAQRSAQS